MSFNRGCESRSGLEHITKHSCVNTDSPAQQYWRKAVVIATCSRGYHEGKSFWSLLEYRQTIAGEVGHSTAVRESEPVQSSPFNPNRHLTGLCLQEGILPFVRMCVWVGGWDGGFRKHNPPSEFWGQPLSPFVVCSVFNILKEGCTKQGTFSHL